VGFLAHHRSLLAGDLERQSHILKNGSAAQEFEVLKHEADLSSEKIELRPADPAEVDAVDDDLAFCRRLRTEDQSEEGGLSCSARPGDKDKLPRADSEVNVFESRRGPKGFGDMK